MKPKKQTAAPGPKEQRKRFRLEKLEERIAPKGHYNPHTKWVGDGNDGGGSNSIGTIY